MKKLLLTVVILIIVESSFAQNIEHIKLSNAYPSNGEKLSFIYNAKGTVLEGKKSLQAIVYFIDGTGFSEDTLALKFKGTITEISLQIPQDAKAFFIKFFKPKSLEVDAEIEIDNNNGQGYVFLVYKNEHPVEGAYLAASSIYSRIGSVLANIKISKTESNSMFQKEFELYPDSKETYKSKYYSYLVNNQKDNVKQAEKEIEPLLKSQKESDLILASQLYLRLKDVSKSDSLNNILKQKFPDGEFVKGESINAIIKESSLQKKQEMFDSFSKKYPGRIPVDSDNSYLYGNMLNSLTRSYLENDQPEQAIRYASLHKDQVDASISYSNMSFEWAKQNKHLDLAAQQIQIALSIVNDPKNKKAIKPYYNIADTYLDIYSYILFKQGQYKQALNIEKQVYVRSDKKINSINEHFALILAANNENKEAQQIMEQIIKEGKASLEIKKELKDVYNKIKGSNTGYEQYLSSLENFVRDKMAKEMINKPAPLFTLKDTSGKVVSLADLKGKVVVIDFWATWCGPCKASFPGMQLAVNKYKNDPNVKFLFIDTWETDKNYLAGVEKFITDNHYTFDVLMDEKGNDNRQSKVVSTYDVPGIPSKFILDKNGNIRFKHVGFEGSAENLRDEMTMMIEMATNPETVATKPEKVSVTKGK